MVHHVPYGRRILYKRGQAMLIAVIFFVAVSAVIIQQISVPTLTQIKIDREIEKSKKSYSLAEAALEEVIYRLRSGKQVLASETLDLNGGTVTVVTTNTATGKRILATASVDNDIRKVQADLVLGTGISFHYGVQAGNGGFVLSNSSSVTGNIHSSGPITGSGNLISGDAVSAGPSGFIQGVHITGSAFAHTLGASGDSTEVDRHAYYSTLGPNVTVGGTKYPGTADQAIAPLPIPDEQINEWEAQALAGGTLASSFCDTYDSSSNTCTISSTKTLGPKKVPFNLLIKSSSGVLTIAGPVWVTGNITAQTGPTIKMASGLGSSNVAVIADNPSDRAGSGIISIGQSTIFSGSGAVGSFVFMISQNTSAENGGTIDAISMNQGAAALVAYASHGQITLSQSVSVKEVTAYKIRLTQSANVTYDTGLPSTVFSSGPSGGYSVINRMEVE